MSKLFDIGVDSLAAGSHSATNSSAPADADSSALSSIVYSPIATSGHSSPQTGGPVSSAGVDKSFFLETFGCQMNAHDSEKVAGVLLARGYRAVDDPAGADLVLYNTCSIREKAAQKVFARLGDWKTTHDGKVIGVLGCLAQQEGEEIFERAPWVSLVCGSASYRRLPGLIAQLEAGGRRVMGLDLDTEETFESEMTRRDNLIRAYITIIEGCDYACSYCVVPRTRGPERSRPSGLVLGEARRLAAAGYTEIQLLGQTVNSYRDPSPRGLTFVDLLKAVAAVEGIRRVRFTTSHPNDFHRGIVDAIEKTLELCNHIHLPVQSGSTRVLREMRRTYSREEYLEKIHWIRDARRPMSLSTDIIVGFPGETTEDFEETMTLLDEVKYDSVFAFKYSPRPNTTAQNMVDAVPEEEKSRRLAILLERQRQIQTAQNQKLVGCRFEVLVDGRQESRAQWAARTSSNRIVHFPAGSANLLGQYVQVEITRSGANSLMGEQVASDGSPG